MLGIIVDLAICAIILRVLFKSWHTSRTRRWTKESSPSGGPYVWWRKGVLRAASRNSENRGHFGVDESIDKLNNLSKSSKEVYVYLSKVADTDGYCFPFLRTIASRTNLSQSTVSKALRELENTDLVQARHRYSKRGGSSNLYRVRKVGEVYPQPCLSEEVLK